MIDRAQQLRRLVDSLDQLVAILQRDPTCTWTRGFEVLLSDAQHLQSTDFEQNDLNLLSGSVMSVFGGMGSFSDYVPQDAGRVAPWIREFDEISGRVYEDALNLRVVGHPA
jgi:hypothetical protein